MLDSYPIRSWDYSSVAGLQGTVLVEACRFLSEWLLYFQLDATAILIVLNNFLRVYVTSYRKGVERAFRVLQVRFAIVQKPAYAWTIETLSLLMMKRVILHNIIVEDDGNTYYVLADFGGGGPKQVP